MILHLLDQCIYSKTKWMMGKDLILATRRRSATDESRFDDEEILVENAQGRSSIIKVQRSLALDPALQKMEYVLQSHVCMLSKALERYGYASRLESLRKGPLDWKMAPFLQMRSQLVDMFAQQNAPTDLIREPSVDLTMLHSQNPQDSRQNSQILYPDISSPLTPLSHDAIAKKMTWNLE